MARTRYLLIWFAEAPIVADTIYRLRRDIEDRVKEPRSDVEIDVWVESGGGIANAAFKLALMLRDAASRIRVVIPDFAKSAATLLALAGHEIYMAPGAELGPLDMQLYEEGKILEYTSALNIAKAADDIGRDAVQLALQGGAQFLRVTRLSRVETMTAMLKFASEFYAPLVSQLDPKAIYDAKQELKSANRYAEELLAETCGQQADRIAEKLVGDYPTHGFVISYDMAHRLGLPVRPLAAYDLVSHARQLHRASEDGGFVIRFCSLDEYLEEVGGGDSGDSQVGGRAGASAGANGGGSRKPRAVSTGD